MQRRVSMILVLCAVLSSIAAADSAALAAADGKNPIGAVIGMCQDLAATVQADGEAAEKAYRDYAEWCDKVANEKKNEITTATSQKGKLEASIDELASENEVCDTKIADLVAATSENNKDLAAATKIREEEASVFASNDAALVDVVDTLARAIGVLQKEMGSASFAQMADSSRLSGVVQSLSAIIGAASLSGGDKDKLLALVQAHDDAEEGEEQTGAQTKKSAGILEVLEGMKEEAEGQLSDLRKSEMKTKGNYNELKQSISMQIANDEAELAFEKKKKAGAEEAKATATGELEVTVADIKDTEEALKMTQDNCMQVASDFEAAQKARAQEVKVINQAIKILEETTGGGALVQTDATDSSDSTDDDADSFMQTMSVSSKVGSFMRKLSKKQHSTELAQLASRINAMIRSGVSDPFVKVRGMIEEMIDKLDKQMGAEAQEKAYCDEEMSKTEEKEDKLETAATKLTNKIDRSSSRSAELKEQVTVLQNELAVMAKEMEEATKVREEEHKTYLKESADLKTGLGGVRKALDLLRSYYGSAAAAAAALVQEDAAADSDDEQPTAPQSHSEGGGGAGGGIINILEVAESDMADELTKVEAEEADAQAAYDQDMQEFKVTKAGKDQDVKYKTQEAAGLDKSIVEYSSDRDSVNTELAAVKAYSTKIQERCVAKPVSYEERKKAREAEIEGLKEGLAVLENEAGFVQQRAGGKKHRHMRGAALETDE